LSVLLTTRKPWGGTCVGVPAALCPLQRDFFLFPVKRYPQLVGLANVFLIVRGGLFRPENVFPAGNFSTSFRELPLSSSPQSAPPFPLPRAQTAIRLPGAPLHYESLFSSLERTPNRFCADDPPRPVRHGMTARKSLQPPSESALPPA